MNDSGEPDRANGLAAAYAVCIAVVAIALIEIVIIDRSRPQGFDEPAHIAAGIEWLQFHTYRLDPLHPPLARVAMAAPLYFSGERFQERDSRSLPNFWDAGNSILNQRGQYLKNLSLARLGVLPFFALLVAVTFIWTRGEFGALSALVAVILLSTLPVVLSFASLAYTDLPAACLQVCCVYAFVNWPEKRTAKSSVVLGALFGLAVLTKFTSLIYVPVAATAILLCFIAAKPKESGAFDLAKVSWNAACIGLLAVVVIWGGYRFSVDHVDEIMAGQTAAMPTFQHFPKPVRGLAKTVVEADWKIPAPSLLRGLGEVWVMNKTAPDAYLFGNSKPGGWWYFFVAEAFFKTPLPFMALVVCGCFPLYRKARMRDWKPLAPAIAAFSVAILTTIVSVNFGLRHVLVVFPLLAIVAGLGASELSGFRRDLHLGEAVVVLLLAWQCMTVLRPGTDWIAYFNACAGADASKIVVTGCDLDCGQDVLKLSAELNRRHASEVALALWTSADLSRVGLPRFHVLEPFQPESGWIAVSVRAMREGSVFHQSYPPGALAWLEQYAPAARIGSTIWLYYLPQVNEQPRLPVITKASAH